MSSQWKLVPVEPTETMVIHGFESAPNECFTDYKVWDAYQEMSGCQQAAFRAKLCWAAMIAAAPAPDTHIAVPEESAGVEFGIDGRSVRVSQEAYSIFLAREAAGREKIAALQRRLTAADERADVLETALRKIKVRLDAYAESDMRMPEPSVEVCQSIADAALRPAEGGGKPCACPGCDSPRRENSPFCVAHRSVKSRTRGQDPLTADGLEWLMQNDGLQQ